MATTMHRLQISIPEWQAQYLADRAKRTGVSIAEIIRRLVKQEAELPVDHGAEKIWELAGLAEDHGPIIDGIPVSEKPELYLTGRVARKPGGKKSPRRAKR